MLFTTRYAGKGAIGYLISDDLINWEKEMMEYFHK